MIALDALRPEDAPQMLRLAIANGQQAWTYTPGAHGIVARDAGGTIRGFCLLRETLLGFVVDELWCDLSTEGVASLGVIARWLEAEMKRTAAERAGTIRLGGIVRLDNPRHKKALVRRGFTVVAEVLTKEFDP